MASLNNYPWVQWRPLTPVGKTQTYIQLPEFSYPAIAYENVSELIVQYNFSANQNFYLKNRPRKPLNVNYLLCIKYRVGDTVYRYKLWNGVGETGMDDVPLYNGHLIKANFVLEVWSVGAIASQATVINIITSVTRISTDLLTFDTDQALAVGTLFDSFGNIVPTPINIPATIAGSSGYYRYKPDGLINSAGLVGGWTNSGSLQTAGDDFVPVGFDGNFVDGPNGANQAVSSANMLANIPNQSYLGLFMVCKLLGWTADADLIKFYTDGSANGYSKLTCGSAGDGSPSVKATQQNAAGVVAADSIAQIEMPIDTWGVLCLFVSGVGGSFISQNGSPIQGTGAQFLVARDRCLIDPNGLLAITDIVCYNGMQIFGGEVTDMQQVITYLFQQYPSIGFQLPISFEQVNNGAAWIDNE